MPPRKCCCGECGRCCYPSEYHEPPGYPAAGWYAQILKWEIDAPLCPAIDGLVGQFQPETTGPHTFRICEDHLGNEYRVFCLCYTNSTQVVTITGSAKFDNGTDCIDTPCGVTMCFGLQCVEEPVTEPLDEEHCCKGFRLIVIFIGATPAGGEPIDTNSECFEGEGIQGNPNFPGCNQPESFPARNARQIRPFFCQCEDVEQNQEFELQFNLNNASPACGEFFIGGNCAGQEKCCTIPCSFAGATVKVTKL